MRGNAIISALAQGRLALQAKGVRHLALFGSHARGEAAEDSDLDVLVDIDPELPKFSLFDLAGVANLLTDITGIEAHPIERKMLAKDPRFAERIADDIVEIF
ncbi:MAG: nucleotidyltransferase domain-containing protein [Rhodomicrobium sp.]